jgi:hypothetical protein
MLEIVEKYSRLNIKAEIQKELNDAKEALAKSEEESIAKSFIEKA